MTSIEDETPSSNISDILKEKHHRPRFETTLRDNTVLYVGRRGELAVEVNGFPSPTVKWMFKDTLLIENERIQLNSSQDGWHKLIINDVNNNDNGVYKVIATNTYGEKDSQTTVLVDIGPPIISSLCKSDIKLKTGEKLCIVVSIKDYGEDYDVKWFKNLSPITEDPPSIKITKKRHMCSLKITSVELKDTGQYKCVVSAIGETSIKFNADVTEDTKEKQLEESDDCWHNNIGGNQSICNRSVSLGNLLDIPVTEKRRKSSLDITKSNVIADQCEPDKEIKGCVAPDIYSSLTPSNNRNGVYPKRMLSCIRLKTFFRETLHFRKHSSDSTIYKAKSFSNFHECDDDKIKQYSFDLKCHKESNGVPNATLKVKSASLSNILDMNDVNDNTYRYSHCVKGSSLSPNAKDSKTPKNRSLVDTMKHSIGRRIYKAKTFVGFEGKSPPPHLVKYSRTHVCSGNECRGSIPAEEEGDLFVTHLTYEDKQKMEKTLHTKINGSFKWETLSLQLCEKGYIQIDKNEIELCKYPQRINVGKELIQFLTTCNPDFSVKEFRRVAKDRNREDICMLLAPFYQFNLVDIPCMERQKLEILCSLQTSLSGYTWKLLAEDFQLGGECINSIEASLYSISPSSPLEEIFKIFQTRNPAMPLQCIIRTLRELHFNDSANSLECIVNEKRKQIELLQSPTSSEFLTPPSPRSEVRSDCM